MTPDRRFARGDGAMGDGGLGRTIEAFLEADGFAVARPAAHCLAGLRDEPGAPPERRYVWFSDPEHGIEPAPAALLEDFAAARDALGDHALGYYVTPSLTGLATNFRQAAHAAGIRVRVPVQFFDTAYKDAADTGFGEGLGSDSSEVFRAFQRQGKALAQSRVPQPFEAMSGLGNAAGGFGVGPDLLAHLVAEMSAPPVAPRLTIVLGNAGAGKSYLFAALFAELHARFLDEKRRQRQVTRPVLFLPDHIRGSRVATLDGLLEAVSATEAAATTRPTLMRFLNTAGFTTWMFDGLDEFFAGETDFVDALQTSLDPASRAQILICARDSLLTSSSALRGLIDRNLGNGAVHLYELARWQRPAQRALAFVRQVGRLPGADEIANPPKVQAFLAKLDGSPAASDLASLPFYCDLMLAPDVLGQLAPTDELDLVAAAVDGLVDREQAKLETGELGFRWDVFSGADNFVTVTEVVDAWGPDAFNAVGDRERLLAMLEQIGRARLVELIEGLAHQMRTTVAYPNESKGLTTEEIEDLANYYLDVGVVPDLEPRILLAVVQLAFFGPGDANGHVRFAHEIIADFLAGREAMRIIAANSASSDSIGQALGVRRDLDRSIFLRYLTRELMAEPELAASVRAHIEAGRVRDRSAAGAGHLLAAMNGAGV